MSLTPRSRKRLGQHFLHDHVVIDRLISTISPVPKDNIVEIGSGGGALTLPLIKIVEKLHVIELDERMTTHLMEIVEDSKRLIVHQNDVLKVNFASLTNNPHSLRVVGNLPYNISTPILFHLLNYRAAIKDMHVMLQKEVATRITASPGGKDYGRLTVMLAPWIDAETCFDVEPGAFTPAPKVTSTVLRLIPRDSPRFPLSDEARFSALVARAFSMRRKMLTNSLRGWLTREQIISIGIDPTNRPENLFPEDFGKLAALGSDDWIKESEEQ